MSGRWIAPLRLHTPPFGLSLSKPALTTPFGLSLSKPASPFGLSLSKPALTTPFGLSLSKPTVRTRRFDKLSANGGAELHPKKIGAKSARQGGHA